MLFLVYLQLFYGPGIFFRRIMRKKIRYGEPAPFIQSARKAYEDQSGNLGTFLVTNQSSRYLVYDRINNNRSNAITTID